MRTIHALPVAALLLLPAACASDGGTSTTAATATTATPAPVPAFDADRIVDVVDNPYLPLVDGARWVYDGVVDGEEEHVEVVVTGERRTIVGIDAVVVRDTVRDAGGMVTEDTEDWFAQDTDGNVWYLGEASQDFENGELVSTEGSWETGVDGAAPGLAMPAEPIAGMRYAQEDKPGEAEDMAEVVEVGDRLLVREWSPFEPGIVEQKAYEAGVGMTAEEVVEGGEGGLELVEHDQGHS
jgi:hypothetical protein